jgi:Family of unknown function (DUF5906)
MANDNLLGSGNDTRLPTERPLELAPALKAYLDRIGASLIGMMSAAVFEHGESGYMKERDRITFLRDGKVLAKNHLLPTDKEAADIKAEILALKLPTYMPIFCEHGLPPEVAGVPSKDVFLFKEPDGRIGTIQVRKEKTGGGKCYLTYTHWSDAKWRLAEPDGLFPLWGLDQLKERTTVFIHEGAKSARFCADVASGAIRPDDPAMKYWPWREEIIHAAHLGWIGGALRPHRTDWAILRRMGIQRIYIVADNDSPGTSAVPVIAKAIGMPCVMIAFTEQFPHRYDLADPVPKELFAVPANGKLHYNGPSLSQLMRPATWATRLVPKPKGEGFYVELRRQFIDEWRYIRGIERYVNIREPQFLWTAQQMNANTAAFADKCKVAELLLPEMVQPVDNISYNPSTLNKVIYQDGQTIFNTYRPSDIRPVQGDVTLFFEFMTHLIPDEEERRQVLRWLATLIARPDIRMTYALILCGEVQGTGKSTLATAILQPLVGAHNVRRPKATELQKSEFNGWAKESRLGIIEEIYEGHSWAVYNKMKDLITEDTIRVNEKFMLAVEFPNWIHFFATSNQLTALKIERGDRRWLMPSITEELWHISKFKELRSWLATGGLENIAYWAANFDDYVQAGEHSPMTELKRQQIAWSRDPKEKIAKDVAEMVNAQSGPTALDRGLLDQMTAEAMRDNKEYSNASPQKVTRALQEAGLRKWDRRLKVGGEKADIFLSSHAEWEDIFADPNTDPLVAVRQRLFKKPM